MICSIRLSFVILFVLIAAPSVAQDWLESNERAIEYFSNGDLQNAIMHARLAVEQVAKDVGVKHPEYAQLQYNLGYFLERNGEFEPAAQAFVASIQTLDILHGESSDFHRDAYDGASFAFYNLKNTDQARNYTRKLMDVELRLNGRVSQQYAAALHRLAWIERESGNLEEAEPLFLDALELRKQIFGFESEPYSNLARNTGDLYKEMNRFEKAIEFYELERTSVLAQFGEVSEKYVAVLRDQATFYLKTVKNIPKAFEWHKKRIEILHEIYTFTNRDVMQMIEGLADEYYNLYAYQESVYFREIVRDVIKAIFNDQDSNYAVALLNLGYTLSAAGDADAAIENLKESVRIFQKNMGDTHDYTILAMETLQQTASTHNRTQITIETATDLLQIFEEKHGKNSSKYTTQLVTLAMVHIDQEEHQTAIPYLKEAIEIEESLSDKSSLFHQYHIVLGGALLIINAYDEAEMYLTKGLRYAEETYGRGLEYAAVLDLFFSLELARGNSLSGLEVAETKLELYTQLSGPSSRKTIESWNDLGLILGQMKLSEESYDAFNRARTLALEHLGENHKEYIRALVGASESLENTGRFDVSEELILTAIEVQTKNYGPEHPEVGIVMRNLGRLYMLVHDFEQALEILQEAERILEPHKEAEFRDYNSVLFHIGMVYTNMREIDKAIEFHKKAYEARIEKMPVDHPDVIESAVNLGHLSYDINNLETSMDWYTHALELSKNRYGIEHSNSAAIMNGIGKVYQKMGNADEAMKWYEEAVQINAEIYGEHSVESLPVYSYISSIYSGRGDYVNMDAFNAPILENYRNQALQQLTYLSESRQEQFFRFVEIINDMYINTYSRFVDEHPEAAVRMMEISLFNKGLRLRSSSRLRSIILQSDDESLLTLYDQWVSARSEIQALLQQPEPGRGERLTDAESRAEQLERELMSRSRAFREESEASGEMDWIGLRDVLHDNEAIIDFLSYFEYDEADKPTGEIIHAALIIRKNESLPLYVQLGKETELQTLLKRDGLDDAGFISGLYRQIGGSAIVQTEQFSRGKELFSLIWEPLIRHLQDVETVYYSPSGTLNQLSFAAIPIQNETLLSDVYQLRQVGSASSVFNLKNASSKKPSSIKLYGGIDYDTPSEKFLADATGGTRFRVERLGESNLSRGGSWSYLPGTLLEAQQIFDIARENNIQTTLSEGTHALEDMFKQLKGDESPDVIHIATHGFFFDNPEQTADANTIAPDSRQTFFQQSQNPLNRSGLLFSGANYTWNGNPVPEGIDDGILTAYEVSNLFLPNTQLVVLSACETGLGDIRGSEGVFGLQRAFRMAGVQNLIMSLWEVPDRETAEFMTHFYESWLTGLTIHEAFHTTQDYMKNQYPEEPFKWAAFVLLE